MKTIFDPAHKNSINQQFRKKRFEFFIKFVKAVIGNKESFCILDIGGTQAYWESMDFFTHFPDAQIVLVNLVKEISKHPNISTVIGNATDLKEFSDQSFDIVFSNSVIEHLFSFEQQKKMANEVLRIGKNHFIQTPNYYFPLEPHWMFPFFQFLPFSIRVFLTKNFSLGHIKKAVNETQAIDLVKEVRLLTLKEMQALFSKSKPYKEKFVGFVKSLTMYSDIS